MSDIEDLFGDEEQQLNFTEVQDDGFFGDDDEDDDEIIENKRRKRSAEDIVDELASEDEDLEEEEEEEEESRPIRIREDTIPRFPLSQKSSDSYFARIPAFMSLEPRPFDALQFLDEAKAEQAANNTAVRLANENTVRWKYARKGGVMVKQSNARFIRWSDGTLSLQLGQEIFDVELQDLYDSSFLCLSHTSNELLQTSKLLTKGAKFVPTSTLSKTHIRLAQALTKKQLENVTTVRGHATVDDPEKIQREAEKQQQLTMKARRKLESKRLQQQEDYGFSSAPRKRVTGSRYQLHEDDEEELGVSGSRPGDDYEEDDFVVDDENEEALEEDGDDDDMLGAADGESDSNADRLRQVKQKGQDVYRDHKKRRVIDDDDED